MGYFPRPILSKSIINNFGIRTIFRLKSFSAKSEQLPKYLLITPKGGSIEVDVNLVEEDMSNCVNDLKERFAKLHVDRMNSSLLNQLSIKSDTNPKGGLPLSRYGTVMSRDANTLVITLYDQTNAKLVQSSLQQANLNLTVTMDGSRILVVIPKLTKELRAELAKSLHQPGEIAKRRIRDIRTELLNSSKVHVKDANLRRQLERCVEELQDKYIETVEKILEAKKKEIVAI